MSAGRRSSPTKAPVDPPPLLDFIPQVTPTFDGEPAERPVHLSPVINAAERIAHGERVELAFSVPPRHYKSSTLKHLIVWLFKQFPGYRVAYLTHSQDFAEEQSRDVMRVCECAGLELGRTTFAQWETTTGCLFKCASLIQGVTGRGFNLIVVDDPYRKRQDAESVTTRRRVIESFRADVYTRQSNRPTSFIVLHTRWHPDDLIGNITSDSFRAEGAGFDYINLPALSPEGEALAPTHWPAERLEVIRDTVSEYEWWSQYMGEPRPRGSEVFGDPTHAPTPAAGVYCIGIDLAYSSKKLADYSTAVVLCRPYHADKFHVVEVIRAQCSPVDFGQKLQALHARYQDATMRWYASGVEKGSGDFLRRTHQLPLEVIVVGGKNDKFVRATPVSAAWNRGDVCVPESAPWLRDFLSEVQAFTGLNDPHDDQVDALAAAYDGLASSKHAARIDTLNRTGRRSVKSLYTAY